MSDRPEAPSSASGRRPASEYLVKGFTMDDERLKQSGGGYFDELLVRIRDIRSSERRGFSESSSPSCRTKCTGPPAARPPPK